jgi:hypothetical protein
MLSAEIAGALSAVSGNDNPSTGYGVSAKLWHARG